MLYRSTIHQTLMQRNAQTLRRVQRRRRALFAVLFIATVHTTIVQGQNTDGELPVSPWSTRGSVQPNESRKNLAQLREPQTRERSISNAEFDDGRTKDANSISTRSTTSSRPAVVTMLGPAAASSQRNAKSINEPIVSNFDSSHRESNDLFLSPAAPKHASTQKSPVDAQSHWQRVQAGGLNIDREPVEQEPVTNDWNETEPVSRTAPVSIKTTSTATIAPTRPIQLRSSSETEQAPVAGDEASPPQTDDLKVQRIAMAQRVSYELLSQNPYPPARAPEYLETPPGWGAIEQELKARLERCDSLLRRNAVHSARDEAIHGLRRLCRTMDAHRRMQTSTLALEKALTALREDADFIAVQQNDVLQSIIASHTTEALKGRTLTELTSDMASQHYRYFAQFQFVQAADGHRWASDLLYAFGKTLEKEAEGDVSRSFMLRSQSVACYQAALQISPAQSDISNQLGFVLIHLDRIDEAYQALHASLNLRQSSSAWNNLAEIYRRRGASSSAEYAIQQASAISAQEAHFSYDNPQISEVDASTFAKFSPMPIQNPGANNPSPTSVAPQATARAASPSMFSKIFKR